MVSKLSWMLHTYCCSVTGADPPAEADPSPEQISLMSTKMVGLPILTAHGGRAQKSMKAKKWLLRQMGHLGPRRCQDLPVFLHGWLAGGFSRAVLLMLQHEPAPAGESKRAVATCGSDCMS